MSKRKRAAKWRSEQNTRSGSTHCDSPRESSWDGGQDTQEQSSIAGCGITGEFGKYWYVLEVWSSGTVKEFTGTIHADSKSQAIDYSRGMLNTYPHDTSDCVCILREATAQERYAAKKLLQGHHNSLMMTA